MDPADSSLFTQDFAYENELNFSTLVSPSTFTSFQEPNPNNPIIHCAGIENDRRQQICTETNMTLEITRSNEEPKNKRAKHKEIERKRRHETTSLFKILRDLLPYQYLRGTRSTSDHILEAVNYIKDLQKKIKEFTKKRDRIKRSIITHLSSTGEYSLKPSTCSCVGDTHVVVVVRSCLIGLEIVVSCCVRHKCCLSSVLQLLAQEQCLNVVSCISSSTGLHQRFTHTIVLEIEEGVEVYLLKLQEKIMKMVTS